MPRAALLFWRTLTATLIAWGFEINQYDWCVANKMIDGKQGTILWHVDDLKISHVKSKVVTLVIILINAELGKEAPITVQRGRIHEYLGMTLDFTKQGKVIILTTNYIDNMLDSLNANMDGVKTAPAVSYLFNVKNPMQSLSMKVRHRFSIIMSQRHCFVQMCAA